MGGRWLKNYKSWLKEEKVVEDVIPIDDEDKGVLYIPLRCPRCQSKDVRCYASRQPIRYHYCKKCKKRFKSVEED